MAKITIHQIYRPFVLHFRRRRIMKFYKLFRWTAETKVLDVGGTLFMWDLAKQMGLPVPRLTLLNLSAEFMFLSDGQRVDAVEGSGTHMPFRDQSFDIVFSNSVIEHLFSSANQALFANEIERVGKCYFVQTPDPVFFIEPHYLTPFIHWFPTPIRAKLIRNFTITGLVARPTKEQARQMADEIQLVPKNAFQAMFSRGKLIRERLAGIPKSLIMYRLS